VRIKCIYLFKMILMFLSARKLLVYSRPMAWLPRAQPLRGRPLRIGLFHLLTAPSPAKSHLRHFCLGQPATVHKTRNPLLPSYSSSHPTSHQLLSHQQQTVEPLDDIGFSIDRSTHSFFLSYKTLAHQEINKTQPPRWV
jgi:hypothetical protein